MNVLIATSEAVPFAKTGGLADVCGALPSELKQLGHDATLIMPAYRQVTESRFRLEDTSVTVSVPVGNQAVAGRILKTNLDGVTVYFIDRPDYFDRPSLYGEDGVDYRDNCERFVFLSRAILETIRALRLDIELIHCHDWQTALIPTLMDAEYRVARGYETMATLLTIHNLAYQGRFWHWDMLLTGLDWRYFNWRRLEFYGDLNLLKGGIVYADALSTVSPTYAEEIQTAPLGCGLEGVLHQRRPHVSGILNGVDYTTWNPNTDPFLKQNYDVTNWKSGKAACKSDLQATLGLAVDPAVPLVGVVGRLVEQKGVGLIVETMKSWVRTENVQWAILGTGHPELEKRLRDLAQAYPQRVAARIEFSDEMAHKIEASADLFLMPSRYEPCGLSQLYSLKYGTVPLVHATGGLKDTITNSTEETIQHKSATGFVFYDYNLPSFVATLKWAVELYNKRSEQWQQIVETGMHQDWSWKRSAQQYADLYAATSARVKQTVKA